MRGKGYMKLRGIRVSCEADQGGGSSSIITLFHPHFYPSLKITQSTSTQEQIPQRSAAAWTELQTALGATTHLHRALSFQPLKIMADTKPPSSDLTPSHQPHSNGDNIPSSPSSSIKAEPIVIDVDEQDAKPSKDEMDPNRVAQAKVRYEADLKKHHYEPPAAARIQDE